MKNPDTCISRMKRLHVLSKLVEVGRLEEIDVCVQQFTSFPDSIRSIGARTFFEFNPFTDESRLSGCDFQVAYGKNIVISTT